jgi:hypothetical protein
MSETHVAIADDQGLQAADGSSLVILVHIMITGTPVSYVM